MVFAHNDAGNNQFAKLMARLGTSLEKEHNNWQPRVYKQPHDVTVCVSPALRDEMAHWLIKLNDGHGYNPETLATSLALLDHFLSIVKASPKYIRCIAVACFFLAAKLHEEDEAIPSTLDFVSGVGGVCSVPELLRMERIILDKFHWNLSTVTALDFLHIYHSLLLLCQPQLLTAYSYMTPGHQLSALTTKLKLCLTHHQLMVWRPAVLSLALLSLELEWYTPNWLAPTVMLQRLAQVDSEEVIGCREMISRCLSECRHKTIVYRYSPEAMNKRAKRKMSESDDDVYDGIKRLYNEDTTDPDPEPSLLITSPVKSCAAEVTSSPHDPCPALQTVEAS